MRDNYELLKSLDSSILEEDSSTESSSNRKGDILYQEDIAPDIAKQILGSRFIDKPGVRWQLVTEQESMTIVAWVPGESEPTTFELECSDEVLSYDAMNQQLNNHDAYRISAVDVIKKSPFNWLALFAVLFIVLMFTGFGIMGYLFSIK